MAEDDASFFATHEESLRREESIPISSALPPRKRTREMDQKASCELCKARKVKCDRAEPACSWCARHNRTCVYLKRQPPGSRTSINAELEAKVNRIDGLLHALGRRVEEHIAHDHAAVFGNTLSPSAGSQNPSSPASSFQHDVGSVLGNTADSQRSAPALSQQPQEQTPVLLPDNMMWQSSNGSSGRNENVIAEPALSASNGANPSPGAVSYQRYPSLRSLKAELPPHDMLYTLVDLYFKHCNTWCPILDRKTIFGTFFGSTSLEEPDRVLLHAIVATTLRFSKDPRLSPETRDYYHTTSKQVVRLYAVDHISVHALRALVIVSLDEFGTSNGPKAWNLLALLAQNVKQLDLCDESSVYLSASVLDTPPGGSTRQATTSKPDSWIEDEGRRRLCWVVYLLDRYATVGEATFDFLLDDQTMRRFLPCSYDLFSKNVPVDTRSSTLCLSAGSTSDTYIVNSGPIINKVEHLGSFSYHCELLRILSHVHEFLRSPVDISSSADMARWRNAYQSLDATLDGWLRGLPSEFSKISALCHSDPASRVANWFMLHSAYVTAVVRLHSAVAYPTARSALFMPSQYAVQRCLSAVHSLADIARDLREANGLDLLGPPFAFSLWVAARLLLVHASTVDTASVDVRIDFFIETLRHVGQHWEVANSYAAILDRVVQRGRQGDMTFANMRRSAYDLLVLISTKRRSCSEPTSTQVVSLCELDNIEVFTFFTYPKTADRSIAAGGQISNLRTQLLNGQGGNSQRSKDLSIAESDWTALGTSVPQSTPDEEGRAVAEKSSSDFWGGSLFTGL